MIYLCKMLLGASVYWVRVLSRRSEALRSGVASGELAFGTDPTYMAQLYSKASLQLAKTALFTWLHISKPRQPFAQNISHLA